MMIPITPLADRTVLLDVRSIERIENAPETVIVLVGGRRMVVVDVADKLVKRINRIHASLIAAAARDKIPTPEGDVVRLPVAQPHSSPAEGESELTVKTEASTTGHVAADRRTPAVSTVNNLHTGLIAFDRALAAIARYRWATSQKSGDAHRVAQQQLGSVRDTVDGLIDTIDQAHSGDVAASLVSTLDHCVSGLSNLDEEESEALDPEDAEATVRIIEATLTKLRTMWARIAADSSWACQTDTHAGR